MVKGVVVGDKKVPVAGATVQVKQTKSVSAGTDHAGRFSINVPMENILFSVLLVFRRKLISAGKIIILIITLRDSIAGLEDVIVVGYGRQRRRVLWLLYRKLARYWKEQAGIGHWCGFNW